MGKDFLEKLGKGLVNYALDETERNIRRIARDERFSEERREKLASHLPTVNEAKERFGAWTSRYEDKDSDFFYQESYSRPNELPRRPKRNRDDWDEIYDTKKKTVENREKVKVVQENKVGYINPLSSDIDKEKVLRQIEIDRAKARREMEEREGNRRKWIETYHENELGRKLVKCHKDWESYGRLSDIDIDKIEDGTYGLVCFAYKGRCIILDSSQEKKTVKDIIIEIKQYPIVFKDENDLNQIEKYLSERDVCIYKLEIGKIENIVDSSTQIMELVPLLYRKELAEKKDLLLGMKKRRLLGKNVLEWNKCWKSCGYLSEINIGIIESGMYGILCMKCFDMCLVIEGSYNEKTIKDMIADLLNNSITSKSGEGSSVIDSYIKNYGEKITLYFIEVGKDAASLAACSQISRMIEKMCIGKVLENEGSNSPMDIDLRRRLIAAKRKEFFENNVIDNEVKIVQSPKIIKEVKERRNAELSKAAREEKVSSNSGFGMIRKHASGN